MSEKRFNYYDNWKTEILTCPKCGWSGTFLQGNPGNDESDDFKESFCPLCPRPEGPRLATVWYPTLAEMEANIDKLSEQEKADLAKRKQFQAEVERTALKSPDALPDLMGSELVLSWDIREDPEKVLWTVLRHGDQVLWTERAVYEGANRFEIVVGILKQKYGSRLIDVVPTGASKNFLYGDDGCSPFTIKRARDSLRKP